ncbi:MAG: replication-associated recombination protein A [Coriobacteriia bacterium]|nr:replication-associated recombination protein A [Coriobacteriia bacterium]
MDLFSDAADEALKRLSPLAARMRPRDLDEFIGQAHAVGPGTALRRAIEHDELTSLILYGPAGCGKTSLARVIANATKAAFDEVSAVTSGVADLRRAMDAAKQRLAFSGQRTILFIDEIHRFSKSQQDALLHAVEDRLVVLIGATTENPLFEVNAPLISRSRVVEMFPLADEDVREIVTRALTDPERGLGGRWTLTADAAEALVVSAGGDARVALNGLEELAAATAPGSVIDRSALEQAGSTRLLSYDKDGDVHFDVASAFIKSMRGSDPDAAVYWLARMVHGGEDPRFIARRVLIFASEDVGNADPQALLIAHAAFKAAESVGWPECRINLSQAVIYMALAPKSNAAITAVDAALEEIRTGPARRVPDHLRDRHRPGSEKYGRYLYPHSYPGGWVEQRYLPDGLDRGRFYRAGQRGWEAARERERPDRGDGTS